MKKYKLLFAFISFVLITNAQQTFTGSIIHDNIEREYIIYIPDIYSDDVPVPLLFNFHGYGSNAFEQMVYGDFRSIADTAGFIIVHPQGTLLNGITHWNVGGWTIGSTTDDVGFTDALIDSISLDFNIDQARIYSTGMSNGGFMSFLLACQLNNRITAIASVTGSMTPETFSWCNPEHPTPILQIHGTSDLVVPYNGAIWSKSIDDVIDYWVTYNNCNNTPVITALPDLDPNDGSTVEHYRYSDGDNDVATEHFKVIGGGHTWPGSAAGGTGTNYDIDASVEIWNFLRQYDIDTGTDIITTENDAGLFVFPNPADDILTVRSSVWLESEVEIQSVMGTNYLNERYSGYSKQLDISTLPRGFYIVRISNYSCSVIVK